MTISPHVHEQFFTSTGSLRSDAIAGSLRTLADETGNSSQPQTPTPLPMHALRALTPQRRPQRHANMWTPDEHERFMRGLEQFPRGPWKYIAAVVGTKTTRQTITHSQKYREKLQRRRRLVGTIMEAFAQTMTPPVVHDEVQAPLYDGSVAATPIASETREENEAREDSEFQALLDTLNELDF